MATVCAVDVGGTFTDLVSLDSETGSVTSVKVSTTPEDPAQGILEAVARARIEPAAFFHGTTIGLNTLLQQLGARTGLITTRGFRDALEIARMWWPMYQLHWEAPTPLVPRRLRKEVTERVTATGAVLQELDSADVRCAADELVAAGVEVIAICFLHAYAAPAHELQARAIVQAEHPNIDVTISHEVTQEYREYERTATTVADGMIRPRLHDYIDNLDRSLRADGFVGNLYITRCDGGVMSAAEAKRRPIRTLLSGPASGVMGAAAIGRTMDRPNLISIDMGGTSFDASLIRNGRPSIASSTKVEGIPLLVPVVEITAIGAGGGSIAWLDAGGALNVGPESAGASPGPICYGRGGEQPTFTDAALVSGLLDAERFLGGDMTLDVDAAREGIARKIGDPLGLNALEAASGVVTLAESKMAATLEELTIGKGHDPREFTLLAYGGGGPLVASALATKLQIPEVIIPPVASTLSAWGMLTLDVVHDFARSSVMPLDAVTSEHIGQTFAELRDQGLEALERESLPPERRKLHYSIDMRYDGQEHNLTIGLERENPAALLTSVLRTLFDQQHEVAYGYQMDDPVEITAFRVRAVGELDSPRPTTTPESGKDPTAAFIGIRRATHHTSGGQFEWAVYDRDRLTHGNRIVGPAIVREATTTVLVSPQQQLVVDGLANLIITHRRESAGGGNRNVA